LVRSNGENLIHISYLTFNTDAVLTPLQRKFDRFLTPEQGIAIAG